MSADMQQKEYDTEIEGDVWSCGHTLGKLLGVDVNKQSCVQGVPEHILQQLVTAAGSEGIARAFTRLCGPTRDRADVRMLGDIAEFGLATPEARQTVKDRHMQRTPKPNVRPPLLATASQPLN